MNAFYASAKIDWWHCLKCCLREICETLHGDNTQSSFALIFNVTGQFERIE